MADSDDRPDVDELTMEAVREIGMDVEEAKARGEVFLSGPASVQLMIRVEEAQTPQEAVELVIRRIAHIGLDTFTFAVTDMLSGDEHFVQAGQLFNLDDVQATIAADSDA